MTELSNTSVNNVSIDVLCNAESRRSFCWVYFGHLVVSEGNKKRMVNTHQVYCLACLSAVKEQSSDITFGSVRIRCYNKTVSTGNLTRHLREDHKIKEVKTHMTRTEANRNAKIRAKLKGETKSSKKGTLKFKERLPARKLAMWFCKSLLPFDYVSDKGMVDFFKQHNIIMTKDEIPSRSIVGDTALTKIYELMLAKVKETIKTDAAKSFALSLESWSNKHRRLNYITFLLHYLTSDFKSKSLTLYTKLTIGSETVESINNAINNIRKSFDLKENNITIVSNASEDFQRAITLADLPYQLCFGQGLHNLVTVDGITSVPEIAKLVHKCKEIVKAVKYIAPELQDNDEKLQQQVKILGFHDEIVEILENDEADPIPESDLTVEFNNEYERNIKHESLPPSSPRSENHNMPFQKPIIPTQWHIILELLENVIQPANRDTLNNVLIKICQEKLEIIENEWKVLQELKSFLKCLQEAVQILLSQKTCTINVALLFRSELIDIILNSFQDDDSQCMSYMKRNMLENMDKRLPVTKMMVAAALIDNRFMGLKEIDVILEKKKNTKISFLSSYIKEVITGTETSLSEDSSNNRRSNDTDTSLLQKLSKKHSITREDRIEQECLRYFATADTTEPKDGDLLAYWNSKKKIFPHISALAKVLLCVPATSTPTERAFSIEGLTTIAKRCRLSPTKVNKMLFIHANHKSCKK